MTSSDAATIQADIVVMTTALSSHLPDWRTTKDNQVHHVSARDAGMPADFNTKEVVYGNCAANKFYVYVLNLDPGADLDGTADSSGYAYLPDSNPANCAPTGWTMTLNQSQGSGWYYVNIDTKKATAQPPATATPPSKSAQ